MDRQSLEPGLMLFIKRKLENSVPLREITEMLLRAGFSQKQIDEAIKEVHNKFPETHQDVVASNSFLPPLKTKTKIEESRRPVPPPAPVKPAKAKVVEKEYPSVVKKGLFAGRLRRRDFTLGFLFFFGAGIVTLSLILGIFSFIFADFTLFVDDITSEKYNGVWLALLPVVLSPITVLLLSIIFRRLHDLSLPGSIAFGFLVFFIAPTNKLFPVYGVLALQSVMVIVFIMLLVVRGVTKNNQHGVPPSIKGSFFGRVFNT